MTKPISYSFENELRCVIVDKSINADDTLVGKLIDFDPSNFIEEIILSPKIDRIVFDNLLILAQKHNLVGKIKMSKIYDQPNYIS